MSKLLQRTLALTLMITALSFSTNTQELKYSGVAYLDYYSIVQSNDERGAEGDVYGKCCLREEEEPFYSPVIQERAWTSPIWYAH